MNSLQQIVRAIGILLLATAIVVSLAAVLVLATDFILLLFLGVLLSVFLTKTSQFVNRYVPCGYRIHLALVTSVLLLVVIGGFYFFGNKIQNRLQQTSHKLDEGTQRAVEILRNYPLAMNALIQIPFAQKLLEDDGVLSQANSKKQRSNLESQAENSDAEEEETQSSNATGDRKTSLKESSNSVSSAEVPSPQNRKGGELMESSAKLLQTDAGKVFSVLGQILTTSLGLVANIGVIFFVGIFIAADPTLYRDGFARLFPLERRARVSEVLDKISNALFSWLLGRFMTMLITGGGTAAALFALQVPMAITAGVVTGLLTFVPNIGGIIALALAVLLAVPQGLSTVGWVIGLYLALQLLESNIINPLLQQQQTSIPPALLISFQVIMGALVGFLGLMVATPMLAASLVVIRQVWIKDILGDSQVEA